MACVVAGLWHAPPDDGYAAETAAALAPPPFDEDESANWRHARIYLEAQRSILEGVAEACAVKLTKQGGRLV